MLRFKYNSDWHYVTIYDDFYIEITTINYVYSFEEAIQKVEEFEKSGHC